MIIAEISVVPFGSVNLSTHRVGRQVTAHNRSALRTTNVVSFVECVHVSRGHVCKGTGGFLVGSMMLL